MLSVHEYQPRPQSVFYHDHKNTMFSVDEYDSRPQSGFHQDTMISVHKYHPQPRSQFYHDHENTMFSVHGYHSRPQSQFYRDNHDTTLSVHEYHPRPESKFYHDNQLANLPNKKPEVAHNAQRFDLWSSLQDQPYMPTDHKIHLDQRFTVAHTYNLELCTESLGSESGTHLCDNVSPQVDSGVLETRSLTTRRSGRIHNTFKSSPPPPPLKSSLRRLHMQSYRENGRLIVQAIEDPTVRCLEAERTEGRLRLRFTSTLPKTTTATATTTTTTKLTATSTMQKEGFKKDSVYDNPTILSFFFIFIIIVAGHRCTLPTCRIADQVSDGHMPHANRNISSEKINEDDGDDKEERKDILRGDTPNTPTLNLSTSSELSRVESWDQLTTYLSLGTSASIVARGVKRCTNEWPSREFLSPTLLRSH